MKINLFKLFNLNEIEKECYLHFMDIRTRQFTLAVGLAILVAGFLALNDFILCKQVDKLVLTLCCRGFFIIVSVVSIILIKKKQSIRIFNWATFVWLVVACSLSLFVAAGRPGTYPYGMVWDVLILLVVYLMVPAAMIIQLFVAIGYSVSLAIIWYIGKLPFLGPASINSLALALTMVNVIGIVFSWQLQRSGCIQFFMYKKDQEIKEQLQRQNEAKNKFFSIISHDLRSPVGNIISICDMAKDGNMVPHDKFFGMINDAAKMAYSLLENLLAWARSESGQLVPVPTEINIDEFITEKILFFRHNVLSKNISIESNDMSGMKVYADYNMLETVLRNLLSNAIKFTPDGGQIKVAAVKSKNNMLEVSVNDNGVGIDEDSLSRLFDLDFHLSTVGTQNETGNGLGLKLCKEFIVKNGGDLWGESKKNVGSTFTFSIPQAKC